MSEPEDHDWVRRVLADAGADPEPVPDWVGRQVEDTLASLREGSPDTDDPSSAVVEMTPRRHRRWAAGLLAAAALTVGGYSLGATGLLGDAGSGSADSATAGDAAAGDSGGQADVADPVGVTALSSESLRADARALAEDVGTSSSGEKLAGLPAPAPEAARDGPVEQGGDSESLERGYADDPVDPTGADAQSARSSAAAKQQLDPRTSLDRCVPPPRSVAGTRRPVSLDDERATAVVRRLDDGRVRVQVWSCESPRRLAQVTVRP